MPRASLACPISQGSDVLTLQAVRATQTHFVHDGEEMYNNVNRLRNDQKTVHTSAIFRRQIRHRLKKGAQTRQLPTVFVSNLE